MSEITTDPDTEVLVVRAPSVADNKIPVLLVLTYLGGAAGVLAFLLAFYLARSFPRELVRASGSHHRTSGGHSRTLAQAAVLCSRDG